jgi:hypothetical protein
MKIHEVGAELFHADLRIDRRTDGRSDCRSDVQTDMTELIIAFRNFAKASKMARSSYSKLQTEENEEK